MRVDRINHVVNRVDCEAFVRRLSLPFLTDLSESMNANKLEKPQVPLLRLDSRCWSSEAIHAATTNIAVVMG